MACFTAPLAQAIVVAAAKPALKGKAKNPFVARIGWLQKMLLGGSFLLAIEHVYHGEIIFTWPFLTAVKDGDAAGMLHEIATVGISMAALVTLAWVGLVLVATARERAAARRSVAQEV